MNSIKHFFISSITLASAALILSSCGKEETPVSQYEATFYVGCYSPDEAYIYKDGEICYSLGSDAVVKGLALMSDGSLYASGYVIDQKGDTSTATIWKDGKAIDIDFVSNKDGFFENMVVNGNNWASCALINDGDGGSYGCVVENGKLLYKAESGTWFRCIDCGNSGDYYVVADDEEGIKLLRISVGASNSLLSSELIASHVDGSAWNIKCIHVDGSDIAVGLDRIHTDNWTTDAYIWINGGRGLQCLENNSEINDITFFGGYIVAAGNSITVWGASDDPSVETCAVQWVDGLHEDFSSDCTGNSSVTMVKNWNGMFLFQAVHSDSGLQLCNNGLLYKEIQTAPNFTVSCWDIDVKLIQ